MSQRCEDCGAFINRVGSCPNCGKIIYDVELDSDRKRRRIEGRMKRSPELVEKIWETFIVK